MSDKVQGQTAEVGSGASSNDKMRWYVVHVYSGMEKSVSRALRERIDRMGMGDQFGQILVPTEEVVEVKGGRKTIAERRFFPGYVLVEMEMTDKTWHLVALAMNKAVGAVVFASGHTDGLAHLVGYADAALPESGVNRLILEGEYAHGDSANLPMPYGNKLAVGSIYAHDVALLRLSLDMMYRS